MKRKQKPAATAKPEQPIFESGNVIACRSLVVDKYGCGWWVDPEAKTIKKAAAA